jgi:hypothetical protein
VSCAGVEGTSSYGAGLTRHLRARGISVVEVERPKHRRRSSRRNVEKSDPSDAERAARAVLAGEASGVPKSGDGCVEMIRALRTARRSAIKARTQAANQLQGLRVTAPEQLLNRLRGLSTRELVSVAARFRLGDGPRDVPTATKFALRSVARRYEALSEEIAELETHLDRLVAQAAPGLVSLAGILVDWISGGKIEEEWVDYDTLHLMQQIGAVYSGIWWPPCRARRHSSALFRATELPRTPVHAKFAEGIMDELQALWSCTLRSPSSVSEARKRSPGDWVFVVPRISCGVTLASVLSCVPRQVAM